MEALQSREQEISNESPSDFGRALAATSAWGQAPLRCDLGPLNKAYGGTPWTVSACEEGSLIFLSAAGSRAFPFLFNLRPRPSGGYELSGEGTGDSAAIDAAASELHALRAADIDYLLKEARSKGVDPNGLK